MQPPPHLQQNTFSHLLRCHVTPRTARPRQPNLATARVPIARRIADVTIEVEGAGGRGVFHGGRSRAVDSAVRVREGGWSARMKPAGDEQMIVRGATIIEWGGRDRLDPLDSRFVQALLLGERDVTRAAMRAVKVLHCVVLETELRLFARRAEFETVPAAADHVEKRKVALPQEVVDRGFVEKMSDFTFEKFQKHRKRFARQLKAKKIWLVYLRAP